MICHTRAAYKAYLAVDDKQLAVRAVVYARQGVPLERVIPANPPARVGQFFKVAIPGGEAAYGVEHDVDLDARPRALGERMDEVIGDDALLKYVGFDVDAVTRLAYGVELGFVKDLAVRQDLDAGSRMDLRVREGFDDADELFGVYGDRRGASYFVRQARLEQCQK